MCSTNFSGHFSSSPSNNGTETRRKVNSNSRNYSIKLKRQHGFEPLNRQHQIITKAGMRKQEVPLSLGQQSIEFMIHAIDVCTNGTLDVITLPVHGGILIDSLLLMKETISCL